MTRAKKTRPKNEKPRPRGRRTGQVPHTPLPGSSHVTPAGGNIFADLGFAAEEAENLKMRAMLMNELRRVIGDMPQRDAATLLGITQPRDSHLKRGRIDLFTIDTLVNMLAHAGARMRVSFSRPRPRTAA
ncbi:MAG: XRE family transcriptional regulator [Gemmatimonadaceae bacterium]